MKRSLLILTSIAASVASVLAEIPLVFSEENTAMNYPEITMPEFEALPSATTLPDPFAWSDGSGRSVDFSDWERHRSEILQKLWHYEIGRKPVPGSSKVTARVEEGDTLVVDITANGETITLKSAIVYPKKKSEGPYPVMIGIGFPSGSLPADLLADRGIACVAFPFWQVMAHTQTRGEEPINRLYPDQTEIGAYSAWPWGISRLIDGLQQVADSMRLDMSHIGVTGCSFAGKMALFAGAQDERIALTIAQEPGGGGVNAWRVSETLGEVERVGNTNYAWFLESMRRFADEETSRLPIDHHQLTALVAPRALLILGNTDYKWLADESGYVSANAAREVWKQFGIEDRMGYSIEGGHPHCMLPESQEPEVGAFLDRFMLGDGSADTRITRADMFTDTDWHRWAPWVSRK